MFDPNPNADKISYLPMVQNAKSTLYLFGADFKVAEKVNIQPNVEIATYSGDNGSDLIPRVTIFYKF
ncbi:MAG: hypothetical protein HY037_02370 [Nitrospirae bacterium]|nr:hypothetical protein [Candidatus Troglogloeales bacterium]